MFEAGCQKVIDRIKTKIVDNFHKCSTSHEAYKYITLILGDYRDRGEIGRYTMTSEHVPHPNGNGCIFNLTAYSYAYRKELQFDVIYIPRELAWFDGGVG